MCALTPSAVYLFTPELHQIEADIFLLKPALVSLPHMRFGTVINQGFLHVFIYLPQITLVHVKLPLTLP